MATVYLTGSGPGDIELLTIKALKIIKIADIIVYDRLANPKILELAKKNITKIYVGKEDGKHIIPQDEINEILHKASLTYKNIVRLKGGDPFVFGRGAEEAIYLAKKGIKFEVIPGITSAIAVPAYAGIPVTHRGVSSSLRIVTGHKMLNNKITEKEWKSFLNEETIVFLMSYHNLTFISEKLLSLGKDKDCPCAVISKGTTIQQKVVIGTLKNIVHKSKNLASPSMFIIGKVVNLQKQIQWFNNTN